MPVGTDPEIATVAAVGVQSWTPALITTWLPFKYMAPPEPLAPLSERRRSLLRRAALAADYGTYVASYDEGAAGHDLYGAAARTTLAFVTSAATRTAEEVGDVQVAVSLPPGRSDQLFLPLPTHGFGYVRRHRRKLRCLTGWGWPAIRIFASSSYVHGFVQYVLRT